jgi:hypothetical protein
VEAFKKIREAEEAAAEKQAEQEAAEKASKKEAAEKKANDAVCPTGIAR